MQQININGKEVFINIFSPNDFYMDFFDEETGLNKRIENEDIYIRHKSKLIRTRWKVYDLTPTGLAINGQLLPDVITTQEDYDYFLAGMGEMIKKPAVNGAFRYDIMVRWGMQSFAIFNEQGELIITQPVPFPNADTNNEV